MNASTGPSGTSSDSSPGTNLLAGRVALVTGGGAGIGLGMAAAMARHGASVVLASRRSEVGEAAAAGLRAEGLQASWVRCDVTVPDEITAAVDSTVEEQGRLDCLIHNALDGSASGPLENATDGDWAALAATSVRASYDCARIVHPHLQATGGSFVLLTSAAGMEGSAARPLYAMAKAAQRGFAKGLAAEWGPDGIRVNCIAPVAMTPALAGAIRHDPSLGERLVARTPLGRIGDPADDVGPVAVFLAGDLSRHVTGQTLVVDGGGFRGL